MPVKSPPGPDRWWLPYIAPGVLLTAAGLLWLAGWELLGLAALALAGLSGYGALETARRLARAEQPRLLMEERLLQTQKLAALGELAAGISHEINNPLAIIRQEAEWLDELLKGARFQDPAQLLEFKESLQEIIQAVERAREVTRRVLDLARERQPVIQKVEVNRILEDMARLVEQEAKKRHIVIERHLAPDLPPLESDGPLLRQAVLNLLTNAYQAMEEQGRIIITSTWAGPDHVKIAIRDTGPGIPAEILPKIFTPFFTTKPPGTGTGLGLAITQTIIHKLGGNITVASSPKQGTTVTIVLPLTWEEEKTTP
jgi:signal transduction histidine kinase